MQIIKVMQANHLPWQMLTFRNSIMGHPTQKRLKNIGFSSHSSSNSAGVRLLIVASSTARFVPTIGVRHVITTRRFRIANSFMRSFMINSRCRFSVVRTGAMNSSGCAAMLAPLSTWYGSMLCGWIGQSSGDPRIASMFAVCFGSALRCCPCNSIVRNVRISWLLFRLPRTAAAGMDVPATGRSCKMQTVDHTTPCTIRHARAHCCIAHMTPKAGSAYLVKISCDHRANTMN